MSNKEILRFMTNTKDEVRNLEDCYDFLISLQKQKGKLLEVITLLKFEKPLLHSLLKTRVKNNPGLSMLIKLTMDYDDAKEKIRKTE